MGMIAQKVKKRDITLGYCIGPIYTRGGNLAEHLGLEPQRPYNSEP